MAKLVARGYKVRSKPKTMIAFASSEQGKELRARFASEDILRSAPKSKSPTEKDTQLPFETDFSRCAFVHGGKPPAFS